jgi:hypothetical protein
MSGIELIYELIFIAGNARALDINVWCKSLRDLCAMFFDHEIGKALRKFVFLYPVLTGLTSKPPSRVFFSPPNLALARSKQPIFDLATQEDKV